MIHRALFVYQGVTQHSPLPPQNHSGPAPVFSARFSWLSYSNHPSAVNAVNRGRSTSRAAAPLSSSRSGVKLKQPCYKTEWGVVSQATEHSGHSALIQKRWPHAASERHGCLCTIHKMGHIQYIMKQREAFIREAYRAEEYSPDEKSPRQVFFFQNDFMLYDLRGTLEKRLPLYQWADGPTLMVSRVSNIRLDGVQESVRSIRIISLRAYQFLLSMPVWFFWPLHAAEATSPLLETCIKKESWRSEAWLHFTEKDNNSLIFYHFK